MASKTTINFDDEMEAALADGASIEDAAAMAADGTSPPEDLNADSTYRTHLAKVLTKRALESASG